MEDRATNTYRQAASTIEDVIEPALHWFETRLDTVLTERFSDHGDTGGRIEAEIKASRAYHMEKVDRAIRDEIAGELWKHLVALYARAEAIVDKYETENLRLHGEIKKLARMHETFKDRTEKRERAAKEYVEELQAKLTKTKLKKKNLKAQLKEREELSVAGATERTRLMMKVLDLEAALNAAKAKMRASNIGSDSEDEGPAMGMGATRLFITNPEEDRGEALATLQRLLVTANAKVTRLTDMVSSRDLIIQDYEGRIRKGEENGGLGRFFKEGKFDMLEFWRAVVGNKNKWDMRTSDFVKNPKEVTAMFTATLDLMIVDSRAEEEARSKSAAHAKKKGPGKPQPEKTPADKQQRDLIDKKLAEGKAFREKREAMGQTAEDGLEVQGN